MTTMLMPFGKHQGKPLSSLPYDYLLWLRTIAKSDELISAVEDAISARTSTASAPGTIPDRWMPILLSELGNSQRGKR